LFVISLRRPDAHFVQQARDQRLIWQALSILEQERSREVEMPPGVNVSGLQSDGGDQFFCGGGRTGKVRTLRRPTRGSAAGSGSEIARRLGE
jgi:hypothetical protein